MSSRPLPLVLLLYACTKTPSETDIADSDVETDVEADTDTDIDADTDTDTDADTDADTDTDTDTDTDADTDADTDTDTDTDTGICGDPGAAATSTFTTAKHGTSFTDCCPAGDVLVGFSGETTEDPDDYIGKLRGECAIPSGSCEDGSVTLVADTQTTTRGGNGSVAWERLCPEGEVVVGFGGRGGWWFDSLTFECAPLTLDCGAGTWITGTPAELSPVGGTGGDPFAVIECPAGESAIAPIIGEGIDEGTGYVTGLGLVCTALSYP